MVAVELAPHGCGTVAHCAGASAAQLPHSSTPLYEAAPPDIVMMEPLVTPTTPTGGAALQVAP